MAEPSPSASLPHPRALPRRFGRYSLFDLIGKGGMAEIYLARARTELGAARLCVVKQIVPEYAHNQEFAEMLIHEAKLAARLNHANIVQVFDLGRADDQLFIAMEYVEGYDLSTLLRQLSRASVPLPVEFALLMITEALKGLDYAHRRTDDGGRPLSIVHRDVSPSNVLVSFEGEVKLCDFGIAHANDVVVEGPSYLGDALKGKAGYMSPEHARGDGLDARADVFQAGIVLWELLAGRRMYKAGPTGPSLLELARAAEIPPLPEHGLPQEASLQAIVQRALAPNRDERYASAAAMLKELELYMRDARFAPSALRFGEWLTENLGTEIVRRRRERERASQALERGPAVVITPVPPAPPAASSSVPERAPASQASDAGPRIADRRSTIPPDRSTMKLLVAARKEASVVRALAKTSPQRVGVIVLALLVAIVVLLTVLRR